EAAYCCTRRRPSSARVGAAPVSAACGGVWDRLPAMVGNSKLSLVAAALTVSCTTLGSALLGSRESTTTAATSRRNAAPPYQTSVGTPAKNSLTLSWIFEKK